MKKYIIRYKNEVNHDNITEKIRKKRKIHGNNKKEIENLRQKHKLLFKNKMSVVDEDILNDIIEDNDNIKSFEEDQLCDMLLTPNDTLFSNQWNMNNTGQFGGTAGCDVGHMPTVWGITTGSASIIVGVVDTGIDLNHEDLVNNIWVNPSPTFGDLNGVRGYDNGSLDGNCDDYYGHGTHVAGIIGAKGNNSTGIAGMNWNIKLMSLRFFNETGSYLSDAINVIEYGVDNGCNIMNHSWRTSSYSQALQDIWDYAESAGVIMVCAAGNDGKDNDLWPCYPASFQNSNNLSVVAHSNTGENSFFTNYGLKTVEIAAPGGNVRGEDDENILSTWLDDNYIAIAGTSMASPHLTGAIALLKADYAGFTLSNLKTLLQASISPHTDQFLTTQYGGRLNTVQLLQFAKSTNSITITRDGVTNISIVPDINDPTKNNITWTDPTHALFAKTIVTRLEWCYPDDANPLQVEVYSGTDETCVDEDLEQGITYGYRFYASYADGKFALPIYVKARGGGEKFACPVPPTNFDFICDYWDENWGTLTNYNSLFDVPLITQAWRACMSKIRTRQEDATYPNGIVGYYRTEKPEPPEVPSINDWHLDPVPNVDEILSFQTIKDGTIFLDSLINKVKQMLKPVELYSTRLSADKWFIWMDYYWYINTGKVRKYNPPSEFYEWDWEYIKLRENWYNILSVLRNILYNCRVLYTANPPYTTELTQLTLGSMSSDTISGDYSLTRRLFYPFWEAPLPTEAEATPPNPPYDTTTGICDFSGISSTYINSIFGEPHYGFDDIIDGSIVEIENIEMVFPILLPIHYIFLSERSYTRGAWFWCEDTNSSPVTKYGDLTAYWYPDNRHITMIWDTTSLSTISTSSAQTDGLVAYASFNEEPESDDPDDDGYYMQVFRNNIESASSFNSYGGYTNKQERFIVHSEGKINLSPSWDWDSYPINFKIILEFWAGGSFSPDYAHTEDVTISPIDNVDGFVRFNYSAYNTVWDSTGGYTIESINGSRELNYTQLYKSFGTNKQTIEIGELYIDNDSDLEWTFALTTDFAKGTLPHLWKSKLIGDSTDNMYTKWWSEIYEVDGASTWNWVDVGGEEAEVISHQNYYCLGRWGNINVRIKVLPDFDFYESTEGVKAHKVPNLLAMTVDSTEGSITTYVTDYISDWNADSQNPKIKEGLVNLQAHWDAPLNRIISQSPHPDAILPYNMYTDSTNALPISYTISAGFPTKTIDTTEGYEIPKIVSMTLTDAETYLTENYPTWSIDSDYITYHYSYNFREGLITSQTPDWKIRTTPLSGNYLALSISLGPPDSKFLPNLRGEYITDAEDILASYNCQSPSSHRVYQYHPNIAADYVIAQTPGPLPYRIYPYLMSDIGLVISSGPSSSYRYILPVTIGHNIDTSDYIADLINDGWDIVEIPVYSEGEDGLIVDQIPRLSNYMGELSTNRLIVSVSRAKSLIIEQSESGVKL